MSQFNNTFIYLINVCDLQQTFVFPYTNAQRDDT